MLKSQSNYYQLFYCRMKCVVKKHGDTLSNEIALKISVSVWKVHVVKVQHLLWISLRFLCKDVFQITSWKKKQIKDRKCLMYEFHCYIFTFMNSREFKIIVVNLVNYNFVRFMAHLKCFCFLSTELRSF